MTMPLTRPSPTVPVDETEAERLEAAERRVQHRPIRDAAAAQPGTWHRLAYPEPLPNRRAHAAAVEVRRGRGVWAPERSFAARVVEVDGGFAVEVQAVTS